MLDPSELRQAFGKFMTGITVVTTTASDGTPIGITANSFTSVSMEPPLLLVCLAKSLNCYSVFENTDYFAINILSHRQKNISQIFSKQVDNRFESITWSKDAYENPLFNYCSAQFSCSVYDKKLAGDHLILIGKIESFSNEGRMGLGYYSGSYLNINMERKVAGLQHPASSTDNSPPSYCVGAIIKNDSRLWLVQNENGVFNVPHVIQSSYVGILDALVNAIHSHGISCHLDTIYSIFNSKENNDHSIYYNASIDSDWNEATIQGGQWVPIDEIKQIQFVSKAIAIMLNRYAEELKNGVNGLYLGNEQTGQVRHTTQLKGNHQ